VTHAARFDPPSIAWRGRLANLRAEAQGHKPAHGEVRASLSCMCGAKVRFTIQSTGISWGSCTAACGVKWDR
jgi:hypothetical protein